MDDTKPYLSVIVAARNDDHGGNLLRRLQIFVNGLVEQTNRHELPVELILVEWNPPADRPSLAEALQWPADRGFCQIRLIEVPRDLHARYSHAESLPLYQMIAKNVGIRRARGEFILSTNLDILFSDELFRFLAQRTLERDRMYRIDRHDVDASVPADAGVVEQLAYCQTHLLRVNAREGTFRVTRDGLRVPSAVDVIPPASGIFLGPGWFQPEQHSGRVFRWAGEDAEVIAEPQSADSRSLLFDLEPGPGVANKPFALEVLSLDGERIGEARIEHRCFVRFRLPMQPGQQRFRFRVRDGGRKIASDPRILNFRVWSCGWSSARDGRSLLQVEHGSAVWPQRIRSLGATVGRVAAALVILSRGGVRSGSAARIGLPLPRRWLERLQAHVESAGISIAVSGAAHPVASPAYLHTNGCGDFTLMAQEHWFDLRGYPEFDVFSMNLDSVLCYAAHHGGAREEILSEPMRIYHIEHASGWSPEQQARLFERMTQNGVAWLDNHEVLGWAAQMERWNTAMIFNRGNWGLADLELSENVIPATAPSLHNVHAD